MMKSINRISTKRKQASSSTSSEKKLLVPSTANPAFYGSNNEEKVQTELSNSGGSLASPLSKKQPHSPATESKFHYPAEPAPQTVITRPMSLHSKRSTSPKPIEIPKASESIILDFHNEPFQFYTREITSTWRRSFRQAFIILFICFFLPSPLLGLIMLINEKGSKKRMKLEERRKEHVILVIAFIMTLIKDFILITMILHVIYGSPVSNYEIAYSPIVFFWCLVTFLLPLTIFYFANVNYVFGFVSDRKTLLALVSPFSTTKAKEDEMKKVNDQEKYFSDNYEDLSSIKSTYDEMMFISSITSRTLWIASILIALIVCMTHSLFPLVFYDCFTCRHFNHMLNETSYHNKTIYPNIYRTVIGLSAMNSFFVSFIAAFYFIYIILWNIANLKEWKRFNATEKDTTKTLINNGPQGIAMWWKIFQTLTFFSSSSICVSVLISKFACVVSLLLILCQSIGLIYPLTTKEAEISRSTATLFLIDNLLLYIALLIIAFLSSLVSRERTMAKEIIQVKKLNIGYELSTMLNIEPEFVGKEQAVPVRLRALRGCLMLLQELISTMDSVQTITLSHWVLFCCACATLFVFPSAFVTFRHIFINKTNMPI